MDNQFPWYDGWWLTRYVRAKKHIGTHAPARMDVFTQTLSPLRTRTDFKVRLHENLFTEEQITIIQNTTRSIKPPQLEMHELMEHGRFVIHDHPGLVDLFEQVAPAVSEVVGEEVEACYSFISLYNANGRCQVHLDAPVAKWTLDFCIDQSAPWPITFSDVVPWPEEFIEDPYGWESQIRHSPANRFSSISMEPGQAVIFSGSSQWHYRDPFNGAGPKSHWDLLFMHFIPAGMKEIAEWKNWERIFSIPGLTEAIR